jgi:hypothetical protein
MLHANTLGDPGPLTKQVPRGSRGEAVHLFSQVGRGVPTAPITFVTGRACRDGERMWPALNARLCAPSAV